jgi:DNA repair/transcription protein MET18/MMS19
VQSARKNAIDTLCALCTKYEQEMVGMGKNFVAGAIVAMDGEKDPRNLIVCFWVATFVLTQFPNDLLTEFYEV